MGRERKSPVDFHMLISRFVIDKSRSYDTKYKYSVLFYTLYEVQYHLPGSIYKSVLESRIHPGSPCGSMLECRSLL